LCDPQNSLSQQVRRLTLMPVDGTVCILPGNLSQAQDALAAGARQERQEIEGCVDLYYRAAIYAWRHLESTPPSQISGPDYQTAWETYQQSLSRLITTASRYRRLDPRGRLVIVECGRRRAVPIEYCGFAWKPCEFCQVLPAGDFYRHDLRNYYRRQGLGVSLVAARRACGEATYYRQTQPFAVTAILRPLNGTDRQAPMFAGSDAVLTFYNPCLHDSLPLGSAMIGLERDLSAPFACLLRESPRRFMEGFLNPGDADVKAKLFMMEPYQRGKIPVVFIHGIWSDPMTWVDTVNELHAQSDLCQRYQFWFFQYPTGGELLESAAKLRMQLLLAREQFDPQHQDPALEQIVLVGHSMGGLVAQLQIAYSYDILWQHAADQPLEAVRTTPEMSARLRQLFFFDPSPLVRRVVFIGTPHRGSDMSHRLIGRAASSLVRYSENDASQYRQLIDDNRDVFKEYLWRYRPTTVDILEPTNPMLLAMAQMPFSPCVQTHSIIGTDRVTLSGEWSDGVVLESSARHVGACSEFFVPAAHDKLHRDPDSVAELMRILRQHEGPR
jgi:pimeloyl-ACP methyl ester carboxylesterase